MALYDIEHYDLQTGGNPAQRISRWLGKALHALQYARMLQALSELSDDQLAQIGLTRSDIPAHARKCVYDIDA